MGMVIFRRKDDDNIAAHCVVILSLFEASSSRTNVQRLM